MNGRIGLMFCCNDDHGNFTGTISRIDVDDLELELEIALQPGNEEAIPFSVRTPTEPWDGKGGPWLHIENFRAITTYCYQFHVGNIFWDYAQVLASDAAELFNYLKDKALVDCTAGPSELYEKFHNSERITAHDLDETWLEASQQ